MSAVFTPETLQKLENHNDLTVDDKKSLRVHLLLEIFANLGVLDVQDVFEKKIVRPYLVLDKFVDMFLTYHKTLFMMYNIPSANVPSEGTHKWCLHIFKGICKSYHFEVRKLGPNEFQLVHPVDEWIRKEGVEGGLWGMLR